MKGNCKNLVYVGFADKENTNLLSILNNLRTEFNFEIVSHKLNETFSPKPGYDKIIHLIYAENDSDFTKIKTEHEKNKSQMSGRVIVVSNRECSKEMKTFSEECINLSNKDDANKELRRVFERDFKVLSTEKGGLGSGNQQQPYSTK